VVALGVFEREGKISEMTGAHEDMGGGENFREAGGRHVGAHASVADHAQESGRWRWPIFVWRGGSAVSVA
jgi:hypothetical protein